MFYFFQRDDSYIQCEIRLDSHGHGYELVIEAPDSVRVERYDESDALNRRWLEVEQQLISEGWVEPEPAGH